MNRRIHLYVSGLVQGVFFRACTREKAEELGVRGFVRNLPDGRVEVVAEGESGRLDDFIEWCRAGPPQAVVDAVEVREEPVQGQLNGFSVRH